MVKLMRKLGWVATAIGVAWSAYQGGLTINRGRVSMDTTITLEVHSEARAGVGLAGCADLRNDEV